MGPPPPDGILSRSLRASYTPPATRAFDWRGRLPRPCLFRPFRTSGDKASPSHDSNLTCAIAETPARVSDSHTLTTGPASTKDNAESPHARGRRDQQAASLLAFDESAPTSLLASAGFFFPSFFLIFFSFFLLLSPSTILLSAFHTFLFVIVPIKLHCCRHEFGVGFLLVIVRPRNPLPLGSPTHAPPLRTHPPFGPRLLPLLVLGTRKIEQARIYSGLPLSPLPPSAEHYMVLTPPAPRPLL